VQLVFIGAAAGFAVLFQADGFVIFGILVEVVIVETDGFQQSALEYPGLPKDEIFEAVDRFYRSYYLRPKPILRIIKTMLEDKDVCVRRLREGYEFFKSMAQRRTDLAAAKATTAAATSA